MLVVLVARLVFPVAEDQVGFVLLPAAIAQQVEEWFAQEPGHVKVDNKPVLFLVGPDYSREQAQGAVKMPFTQP